MPAKTIQYADVKLTVIPPTTDTLWNQACYLTRVIRSRFANREVTTVAQHEWKQAEEFAVILAHVSDPEGFPFRIPEPMALLHLIGAAWDEFVTADPALWQHIIQNIEIPPAELRQEMGHLLMRAHKELDAQLDEIQASQPRNGKPKD
jgi:hypothetical protein